MLKRTLLATAIASHIAHASSIRDDIDLQTYRDFAENKGEFVAGATDIVIRNKNGDIIGTLLPTGVPVPDFSAANTKSGVVTLISPQLTGTVQHNPTYVLLGQDHQQFAKDRSNTAASNLQLVYDGLSFGANDSHHAPKNHYFVVKRNDMEKDLNVHGVHTNRYPAGFDNRKIIKTEDEATASDANSDFWTYYSMGSVYDIALPRLHKLVTETAPTPSLDDMGNFKVENYSAFVHVGAGVLEMVDPNTGDPVPFQGVYPHLTDLGTNTFVHEFLTAGLPPALKPELSVNYSKNNTDANNLSFYLTGEDTDYRKFYDANDTPIVTPDGKRLPLAAAIQPGDSGSGLYGFNKLTQQWELIGFVQSGNGGATNQDRINRVNAYSDQYTLFDPYFKQLTEYNNAIAPPLTSDALVWQQKEDDTQLDETLVEKHKDVYIDTSGTLTLTSDIDQKSGSLYIGTDAPTNLLITGDNKTHTGGGIYVGDGSHVDYQVGIKEKITVYSQLGQTDEYLAKLGAGTLTISGQGNNQGGISVGDGTVILDKDGQAAKYVELASGRGQVILNRANQVKNNDFRFGHKGGVLDLNGQSITTDYLHNVDDGAKIINNNTQAASTLTWRSSRDFVFDKDKNGHYAVIGNAHLDRQSGANTANYIDLGSDATQAQNAKQALLDSQGVMTAFAGQLGNTEQQGELNVVFNPTNKQAKWLLTGGSFVNDLTAQDGTLILAGRPTPKAFDHLSQKDFDPNKNTWVETQYTAKTINANNHATVMSARGANAIYANLVGKNNAKFDIGFLPNSQGKLCVRSDYNGLIDCQTLSPTDQQTHRVDTVLKGDVHLDGNAGATLTATDWTGSILGSQNTNLKLNHSQWQMNQNGTIGNLTLNSSAIKLSQDGDFHTLNVLGDLTGSSQIYYRTRIKDLLGDQIVVHGTTAGQHTLHIANDGAEPAAPNSKLTLIKTLGNQNNPTITLANSAVDLGAYRYTLGNDAQAFYLYNPELDKQAEKERLEAERLAKEQAEKERLAREAEEKAKAEQAERERLAQLEKERLEAERLAKEQAEKERLAREAEEKAKAEQAERERLAQQKQADIISRYTNAALSDLSLQAYDILSLSHRLSQTLHGNLSGIWLQADHSQGTHQSNLYRPYDRKTNSQQLGLSRQTDNLRYGVAITKQNSTAQLADSMHTEQNSMLANIFAKYHWHDTAFMLDLGFGRTNAVVASNHNKRHFSSVGIGINHQFGEKIVILPSVYARHHKLDGANYHLNGANIALDRTHINQIGGDIQLQTALSYGTLTITPSIGLGYQHNQGMGVVSVNNHRFAQHFGDDKYANVGVMVQRGLLNASVQVEQHYGDETDKQTKAGIRLGYTW
ncbi:S6 family peptidase [Moraxella sp. E6BC]|uniref:S6 family peptidase n=2 Tax=unclassified Moraxella TaxID=2685852 RepID=UPI00359D3625